MEEIQVKIGETIIVDGKRLKCVPVYKLAHCRGCDLVNYDNICERLPCNSDTRPDKNYVIFVNHEE